MEITSTEAQNNFGQYLKLAAYEDVIITKNGKKSAILKRYDEKIEGNNVSEIADSFNWDTSKITYEEFLKLTSESENRP